MRVLWLSLLALAPLLGGQAEAPIPAASPDELRELMRQVLRNLRDADAYLGDYAYERYNVRRQFDGDGKLTSQRTILARRSFIGTFGYMQQVERDGKPLPSEQLSREEETFRKQAEEWNSATPETRQAMRAETHRRTVEQNSWLREFPDALNYRQAGEETVDGRVATVLQFEPRKEYKPANLKARVFAKVRGRIWIDKADSQIVRVDAEVFETVNIGWGVLGRINKGTRYHAERRRNADGAWLPLSQTVRFAVRVLLVKSIVQEESTRYSEFRHQNVAGVAE